MDLHFVVIAADAGTILRKGTCPDRLVYLQAGAGETVLTVGADWEISPETHLYNSDSGSFDRLPDQSPIEISYADRRRDAYPPIGDQLDAIWKAMAANPLALHPETRLMLEQVQAVKTTIPKPKG